MAIAVHETGLPVVPNPPNTPDYDTADELEPLLASAGLRLVEIGSVAFTERFATRRRYGTDG